MKVFGLIAITLLPLSLAACTEKETAESGGEEVFEKEQIEYVTTPRRISAGLPATDGLGRKLPSYEEVGGLKKDKFVGLFYWTWHTNFAKTVPYAFNVGDAVKRYPDAAADFNHSVWGGVRLGTYWWGEPLFGYYRETDSWLIRKHAEMLCEAGVDVIIFDCTNGTYTWDESWKALCETFTKCREDGMCTPQIAFMLPFTGGADTRTSLKHLWEEMYSRNLYKDLWFYWKGKPLMIAHLDGVSDAAPGSELNKIYEFFTFRQNIGVYQCTDWALRDSRWGWLEIAPQHGWYKTDKGFEEATVGVAQNWSAERGLTAMNAPGAFGRSYTNAHGHSTQADAVNWGFNFQEQWDRALEIDPEFIFITGWNEWNMGRYEEWQYQVNAFPDEFNQEYSRDIEPMKGGHGDNYYWQMVSNIRRFKGMAPEIAACKPVTDPEGWKDVMRVNSGFWGKAVIFDAFRGNAKKRNSDGWGGKKNVNENVAYDIRGARAAHDAGNLYFFVNFSQVVYYDDCKLKLFIDVDRKHETGWEGYDYMVDLSTGSGSYDILKSVGNAWKWEKCGSAESSVRSDVIAMKVPRKSIGLASGGFSIEFKWADSLPGTGDASEFWTDGDVAPTGRFNYLYKGL